ncbi:flippase [Polynucleobacter paneuropaeus]|nr:flippase [Polynucleobacter paneuropaeus]
MPYSFIYKFIEKNHFQEILKNTGWLLFDRLARLIMSLFIGILLARYLGPNNFGLLNYALAYVAIISVISNMGLDSVVIKELTINPKSESIILGSAWGLKIIGAIATVIICSSTVLEFSSNGEKVLLIITLILSFGSLFQTADVIDFLYQAKMKSNLSVISRSGAFFIASLVKLFLIYFEASLIIFALATILEFIVCGIMYIYTYQIAGGDVKKWKFNGLQAFLLIKASWPLFFSGILVLIYIKIDQIMIGNMLGNRDLGIYSVAVRITEIWYFIPMAITSAVFPTIIKLKAEDENGYLKILEYLYLLMMWLAVALAFILTFTASPLVEKLFGANYVDAATVVKIQCWSAIFIFSGLVSNQWYLLEGKVHFVFYRNILGVFINVTLNLFAIPRLGIEGSAFATLITQLIISYMFDFVNASTRNIFYIRTKIFFLFIPMTYNIIFKK